jgi:hypothetical protein
MLSVIMLSSSATYIFVWRPINLLYSFLYWGVVCTNSELDPGCAWDDLIVLLSCSEETLTPNVVILVQCRLTNSADCNTSTRTGSWHFA